MSDKAQITVLGVYRLNVTESLVQEHFEMLYDYPIDEMMRTRAIERSRHFLKSAALVELQIKGACEILATDDFTQKQTDVPEQRPWCETYLSADGKRILGNNPEDVAGVSDYRIAYFLHFWKEDTPLLTSFGVIPCPAVSDMPLRLAKLVPL